MRVVTCADTPEGVTPRDVRAGIGTALVRRLLDRLESLEPFYERLAS
jgi:hypothetical protein